MSTIKDAAAPLIVFMLIIGAVFGGISYAHKNRNIMTVEGVVQEKSFTASSSTTVTTIGADGTVGVGMATGAAQYVIFVNNESFSVGKETWLEVQRGDSVRIKYSLFGTEALTILEGGK